MAEGVAQVALHWRSVDLYPHCHHEVTPWHRKSSVRMNRAGAKTPRVSRHALCHAVDVRRRAIQRARAPGHPSPAQLCEVLVDSRATPRRRS